MTRYYPPDSALLLLCVLVFVCSPPAEACLSPFETNVRVDDASTGTNQIWPQLSVDDTGKPHAVWMDDRTGQWHVYHSVSTDMGSTWSASHLVDNQALSGWFPSIVTQGDGMVYVVWRGGDYNIYTSRSTDSGSSWTIPVKINDGNTGSSDYWGQSIDVDDGGLIYAAWSDNRNGVYTDVYTSRSTDGGQTWLSPNVRANDDLGQNPVAARPTIRMGPDGVLYLAHNLWEGPGPRYPDVALVRSTDNGQTWVSPGTLVNDITLLYQQVGDVSMDLDTASSIYVTWYHDTGGIPTIRTAVSTDGGVSFQSSVVVPHDASKSSGVPPALCAGDEGHAYVAWQYNFNNEHDIYASATLDGGNSWCDPSVRVDDAPQGVVYQYNPVPAVDSDGELYVVWMDGRLSGGSNYDIWMARSSGASGVDDVPFLAGQGLSVTIRPNPVREVLEMVLRVPDEGNVELSIYDALGRRRNSLQRHLTEGKETLRWRLLDLDGKTLPRGVYYYRISSPTWQQCGRFVNLGP